MRASFIGAVKRGYKMFCINRPQNGEQGLFTSLCLASAREPGRLAKSSSGRPRKIGSLWVNRYISTPKAG